MSFRQHHLTLTTRARSALDITAEVARCVAGNDGFGLAHLFVRHTSCGLMLMENADPTVLADLETLLRRWAPDGDPAYRHDLEGDDDMAAHARTLLTGVSLTLPHADGRLLLGTWQGIFLFEHRARSHRRDLVVTIQT